MHWPRPRTAFSTGYDPIDWMKSDFAEPRTEIQRAKQRFTGQKAHDRCILEQERQSLLRERLVFHCRPQPNIMRPHAMPRHHSRDILWAFGEEQPVEPGSLLNQEPQSASFD